MSIIEIENLTVKYNKVLALDNVTLSIEKNDFTGIIGPNGGGKTTLIKSILKIIPIEKGKIKISSNEVFGYVPQATTFEDTFPVSVKEVILLGHLPKKIRLIKNFTEEQKDHVNRIMEDLKITDLATRQINELSGGQKQKVLIARALMNHPTILILDEPTSGIDESSKKEIYKMLENLNKDMTILIVTHNTNDLLDLFDKIIYINKKAHIHDKLYCQDRNGNNTKVPCPIDWYVEGKKIQSELMKIKKREDER